MNCVPGDTVVCIKADKFPQLLGRVFTVVSIVEYCGVAYWSTEPPQFIEGWMPPAIFSDHTLRPIRRQADDATDESAAWLPPVPSTQKVTS